MLAGLLISSRLFAISSDQAKKISACYWSKARYCPTWCWNIGSNVAKCLPNTIWTISVISMNYVTSSCFPFSSPPNPRTLIDETHSNHMEASLGLTAPSGTFIIVGIWPMLMLNIFKSSGTFVHSDHSLFFGHRTGQKKAASLILDTDTWGKQSCRIYCCSNVSTFIDFVATIHWILKNRHFLHPLL